MLFKTFIFSSKVPSECRMREMPFQRPKIQKFHFPGFACHHDPGLPYGKCVVTLAMECDKGICNGAWCRVTVCCYGNIFQINFLVSYYIWTTRIPLKRAWYRTQFPRLQVQAVRVRNHHLMTNVLLVFGTIYGSRWSPNNARETIVLTLILSFVWREDWIMFKWCIDHWMWLHTSSCIDHWMYTLAIYLREPVFSATGSQYFS